MSVKMKRMDMITLWNLLNKMSQEQLTGRIVKIFIAKNIMVLKPEIELIQETFKAPEAAKPYEEKKREILLKYADRDSQGAIMFEGNNFRITVPEKIAAAQAKIKVLDGEYKEVIEEINKINAEFDLYSKEEQELNLMKIIEDGVPENIDIRDLTVLVELGLLV